MSEKNLRVLLEELHTELPKVDNVDEKGQALLRDLEVDIRVLLERSGDEEVYSSKSILRLLKSAMDHFEITHPKFTIAISELINGLNNAGI